MTLLPAFSLAQRELVRFFRQRSRVAGALGTPLVFWALLGSGFGRSFRPAGATEIGYLEYFFPGTVVMVVLFASIFATISLIEDRREGFLQAVLVAPVSRLGIVLGKMLGGTAIALIQAALLLVFAPLLGLALGGIKVLALLGVLAVLSLALTALGFCIAWSMESVQGFHAVMNLALMPMWLLSGAVFPASGSPRWLALVMACNPLSYGVAAFRTVLYGRSGELPPLGLSLGVTAGFGALMVALGIALARRKPGSAR